VVAVAAGFWHSLALKSDGTVWAWGGNTSGQVGDGTISIRLSPIQVQGLTGITAIAAGFHHSLALRNDGAVFAWGSNAEGELGDGTTVDRTLPVQVPSMTALSVAAGDAHSLAIRSDGTVWAWGSADGGPTGSGFSGHDTAPIRVGNFSDAKQLAAGGTLSVVLRGDGTVWAWGSTQSNYDPYLPGTGFTSLTPVNLNAPAGTTSVATGGDHIVMLLSDGTIRHWGWDLLSQTATQGFTYHSAFTTAGPDPKCVYDAPKPLSVGKIVDGGDAHSVVLASDGTVWTSGHGTVGEIGDGGTSSRTTPVQVPGLAGITAVTAGGARTLVIGSDGGIWGWGSNAAGALGDGTTTSPRPSPVRAIGITGVVSVAAGSYHSVAAKSDGTVWAWGENVYGQVGDGTLTLRASPVQVTGLTGVVAVSAGYSFSLALKSDGTVWGWGFNSNGQIGEGAASTQTTPVVIPGLTDVVAIASGQFFSIALRRDGTVWSWGEDSHGQLGARPWRGPALGLVRVTDLTDVVAVACGVNHALAMKADGSVWTWGSNVGGPVDSSSSPYQYTPRRLNEVTGAAAIGAGRTHSLIIQRDGRSWVFGQNPFGQFGLAQPTTATNPILSGFQPGFPMGTTPLNAVPVSGDKSVHSFDFGFRSAAGASTLRWVQMLFASEWDGGGLPFCYLHYDVPGNGLWLYGESGYFVGPVAPGAASNLLQNAFCAVDPKKTTITKNGATLTVRAQVLFKKWASRKIFMRSLDFNDVDSGWIQEGTWDSTAVVMAAPSVTPNTGSGAAPTFVATFDDASGLPLSTGGWVQFLVAAAADGGGQPFCYLHYDRAGDGLWMYSGDVGFFLGPVKPGVSSTVLQSSACSINTAGTTVQNTAGQLVISSPFTLKSPMTGSKKLFQRSMDALRRDSGWVQTGSWVVQ
jgi:alpha-tubulin suppressor-like RCC1 family protein